MKGGWLIVWFLCALLAPVKVLADGVVIPATAFAKVQIPDQRALIHYANGVETLVIDTSFKGTGTNFAWVVPVPSEPVVEEATTGLFTTLQVIFQPKIVHNVGDYYKLAIFGGIFFGSFIWRFKARKSLLAVLIFWLSLFLMCGLLLPALGTAGSGVTTSGTVEIINRKTVGAYETTTLKSGDGSALVAWLGTNGYATPTNLLPVIQTYAKEGWYFVASKLRTAAEMAEAVKPHPLLFRFKTQKAVYPLRLTGIGNGVCALELYVFGASRAEAQNFKVARCEKPTFDAYKDPKSRPDSSVLRIAHPLLKKLVDGSAVATKLTASLTAAQMETDCFLTWTPFQEMRPTFYSSTGAKVIAANIAVTTLVIVGLVLLVIAGISGSWTMRVRKTCAWIAMIGVVCSLFVFIALPKIEVTLMRFPLMQSVQLRKRIPFELANKWDDENRGGNRAPDLAWVRSQLAIDSSLRTNMGRWYDLNPFIGSPWKEEDSPGNFVVRNNGDGMELVWHDINGVEFAQPLFEEKSAPK